MFSDIKSHAIIRSKSVLVCFCIGNTSDCDYQPLPVKVTHGTKFNLLLVAVDQVNNIASGKCYNFQLYGVQ